MVAILAISVVKPVLCRLVPAKAEHVAGPILRDIPVAVQLPALFVLKEAVVQLVLVCLRVIQLEEPVVIIPAMPVLLLLPAIALRERLVVKVLPALKLVPMPEESVVLLGLVKVKFRTPRVAALMSVVHPVLPLLPVTGAMVRSQLPELKTSILMSSLPEER